MDNMKSTSAAIAHFSTKFINELPKDKSVVSSPLSAEFVLALLTLGTTDPAQTELLNALGFDNNDEIRSSFGSVCSKLKSLKGVTLNVANKVYIQDGDYDLKPALKNDAVEIFDADFEKLNFGDSVGSSTKINQWVEGKTNNKIKNLLTPDSLCSDTRLVLINALYFKGTWKSKFFAQHTKNLPFYLTSQQTVEVPMMFQEESFKYGESKALNAQLLEMDYEGSEASMVIVLPNEIDGLKDVLTKLSNGLDLMHELADMYSTKVRVTIPKFKIETEIDLNELLPKLGIKAIFNENNSGLTNILNKPEVLFVSKAVQKAFIEVNEEGAEAAAATAMSMRFCSALIEPQPKRFQADRPFIAVILVKRVPFFFASYYTNE